MFASLKVYRGISRKGWNRVLMRRCRERNRVDEDGPWTYISQLSRSVDDETYRYYYYYVPAGSDGDLSQICLRTGIAYSALSGVCPRCDRQLGRGLRGLVARDPPARSTRDGFLTARQKVKVCSTHGDTPVTHAQANGVAFAMTVKAEGARVRVVYYSVGRCAWNWRTELKQILGDTEWSRISIVRPTKYLITEVRRKALVALVFGYYPTTCYCR